MKNKKSKVKKIYKIFKGLFTFFLVLVLIVVLVQRFSRNNFAIGGVRIFNVVSESMKPDYKIGDILISKKTDSENIKVGDRVTYKGTEGDFKGLVITHEVVDKREEGGKYYFVTKGTNNTIEDPEISEDNIYGKVVYKTVFFSFLGRLMTNSIVYYGLFVLVGISASYQLIRSFFLTNDEEDDDDEEVEEETE